MPVEARPVAAVVHQEPGSRTLARGRAAAEVRRALEHAHAHPRAREVTGHDRAVVAAAQDDGVVAGVAHDRIVTTPASPSTRTRSPVLIRAVALPVPTTAGMPYSRATIAAWDMIPPMSETVAAILPNTGVQLGEVTGATRISPSASLPMSRTSRMTRAVPSTTPDEPAKPVKVAPVESSADAHSRTRSLVIPQSMIVMGSVIV